MKMIADGACANLAAMKRSFAILLLLASCGQAVPSSPSSAPVAAPAPRVVPSVKSFPLAIALDGNVKHRSDTEYVATGPEILCAAYLIDSDVPRLVSSEVEWQTDPPGGTFSSGASGVFFLPDTGTVVRIYAVMSDPAAPPNESPRLTLIVP